MATKQKTVKKVVKSTKITPTGKMQSILDQVQRQFPTYDLNDVVKYLIALGAQRFEEERMYYLTNEEKKSLAEV
jgi:hypothetical protein